MNLLHPIYVSIGQNQHGISTSKGSARWLVPKIDTPQNHRNKTSKTTTQMTQETTNQLNQTNNQQSKPQKTGQTAKTNMAPTNHTTTQTHDPALTR